MAERIQVELVDDIDGSPAHHTVTFGLDGVTYEIDLSERHAQELRSVFGRYIRRARTPDSAPRASRQQEREERRTRQVNRQLTEQIRGAAQRSRERLSKQTEEPPADGEAPEEPVLQPAETEQESKRENENTRVPAVSLPQFFSAVESTS
jgi:Lsr2